MAVICATCMKPFKEGVGVSIQGVMATEACFMAQGLSQMTFSFM